VYLTPLLARTGKLGIIKAMAKVYEELVEFIARLSPTEIINFHPSEATRQRLEELLERHREASLTPEEAEELENYLVIEHLFRLAKARARELSQQ